MIKVTAMEKGVIFLDMWFLYSQSRGDNPTKVSTKHDSYGPHFPANKASQISVWTLSLTEERSADVRLP